MLKIPPADSARLPSNVESVIVTVPPSFQCRPIRVGHVVAERGTRDLKRAAVDYPAPPAAWSIHQLGSLREVPTSGSHRKSIGTFPRRMHRLTVRSPPLAMPAADRWIAFDRQAVDCDHKLARGMAKMRNGGTSRPMLRATVINVGSGAVDRPPRSTVRQLLPSQIVPVSPVRT